MNNTYRLDKMAAQQLIRYEAVFELLDDIQGKDDILKIAKEVATRWKYFANIFSWRLVIFQCGNFVNIDGCNCKADIKKKASLSQWDAYYYRKNYPCSISLKSAFTGPQPPTHLMHKKVNEIIILPFTRNEKQVALLSAASKGEPFSDLDKRFIRLFGRYLADHVSAILLRQHMTEILVHKATKDDLTGLYNRGAILEQLESKFALTQRTRQPLSIIIADVDHFKTINDRYGHLVGDKILCGIAERLKSQLRENDSVGRFGGEEFLFVLYPCNITEAKTTAERFRRAIVDAPFSCNNNMYPPLTLSVSLGAFSFDGSTEMDIPTLLSMADKALYRSKGNGRNCLTVETL